MTTIVIKNLTASLLLSTALTTAPAALPEATSVNSYDLSQTELKAVANIAGPAKAKRTLDDLDLWLNRLIQKESNGRTDIKILDTNGRHSYGCLQFQYGTFVSYAKRYRLINEETNVEELLYDCNFQKVLAKKMIQENRDNWKHWYTSVIVKDIGLPPAMNLISQK